MRRMVLAASSFALLFQHPLRAQQTCDPTLNPIACENQLAGNPSSQWDISGAGDSNIQGFATAISVNKGETVHFKVDTSAPSFSMQIYRLGYYGGLGARLVASQSGIPGRNQPECLYDDVTGLLDCGNWSESTSWAVPSTATSGIYVAKIARSGSNSGSHIVFVVRDDGGRSDIVFQTSDTTWQAYNQYGGNSLYTGGPGVNPGRAYKVSYNRPFTTRDTNPEDWVFNAEYPMVRWLEANGYNVSYMAGSDTDRLGASNLEQHNIFLSVGHDEYWSGPQRRNVEQARDDGVNLGFFSGNESFWKTRWDTSIDGSGTPYRTLVCYKETHANAPIDPQDPPTWTGTWRDPRFSPPADGGYPENAMTGTIFTVNWGGTGSDTWAITVPSSFAKQPFWRNTRVAKLTSGLTTLAPGTIGYEWDENLNNGFRPAGLITLSSTTKSIAQKLQDYGSTYGPGTATHALTEYRASSGALVFGAGTVQWSWGLDGHHDRSASGSTTDSAMQQATVNLLYDMSALPATLQPGLVPGGTTGDTQRPTSVITSPMPGATEQSGATITVAGTANDTGGSQVARVELSTDGGSTWQVASGTTSWTYVWTASGSGSVTIRSRATDTSGNVEIPSVGVAITVVGSVAVCPCSLWSNSTTPGPMESDPNAVELGMKFQADAAGSITALRFYKYAQNTGTHVGHLWTSNGQLLASVTFSGETASGWQQATLSSPVPIAANTTYVVSYHTNTGYYATTTPGFSNAVDASPLHALADGGSGGNGVYAYGSSSTFPAQTWQASNYWVDIVFTTDATDTSPPTVTAVTPSSGATNVSTSTTVTAAFSEAMTASTISTSTLLLSSTSAVPATVTYNATTLTATLSPTSPLAPGVTYTATVAGGASGVKDAFGNAMTSAVNWSFTTAPGSPPSCPCSLWTTSTTPGPMEADPNAVELGMTFRSDISGYVTGLRFYKYAQNTGTHLGHLWSASGASLGSVTFSGETTSGWQTATFATPIAVSANTTYIISYHTDTGFYAVTAPGFTTGVDQAPLHAPADGAAGGNGVYVYGATNAFPTQTYLSSNYWVDVVFSTTP